MEEILPTVDKDGNITGKAPRSICHGGSLILHPVVHLHLINENGEIFLQKRSMKKHLLPGRWDSAVGGHIRCGESVSEALARETEEELGLTVFTPAKETTYIWESAREREFVHSFICFRYGKFEIHNDEVDEGRFWSTAEIENAIGRDILTPNFEYEYTQILPHIWHSK